MLKLSVLTIVKQRYNSVWPQELCVNKENVAKLQKYVHLSLPYVQKQTFLLVVKNQEFVAKFQRSVQQVTILRDVKLLKNYAVTREECVHKITKSMEHKGEIIHVNQYLDC